MANDSWMEAVFYNLLLAVIVGGLLLNWWLSPVQVAKRKLKGLHPVPIGALRPGQRVKITGSVVLDRRLVSPIHERACAYWQVFVTEQDQNQTRERGARWQGVPFWVEDPSGRVRVDASELRLTLETEHGGRTRHFDAFTDAQAELLDQLEIPRTGLLGMNRIYRFREGTLVEGERIAVYGEVVVQEVDGAPVLALVAPADEALLVSDGRDVHG